jgi:hypothetical protein
MVGRDDVSICRERHISSSFGDVSARYYGGMEQQQHSQKRPEGVRIDRKASEVRDDGTLVELVYDPTRYLTSFVVWQNGSWRTVPTLESGENRRIVPFSPENNLIRTGALLLPRAPEEYGTERDLVRDIQAYIHLDRHPQEGLRRRRLGHVSPMGDA